MRVLKSILRPVLIFSVALGSTLMPTLPSSATTTLPIVERSISAGTGSTCVLRASNAIYCVGDNSFGQLGDGTKVDSSEPVRVAGLNAALSLSQGKTFGCAIGLDQYGYCWGDNSLGQNGSAVYATSDAHKIALDSKLADIQVGDTAACAITQDAKLYCWGDVGSITGAPVTHQTPFLIPVQGDVTAVALSSSVLCLVSTSVYCEGKSPFASSLTVVSGTEGATSVSVGKDFACAVISLAVKCWGDNSQGQLGQGNTTAATGAVSVTGISDVKKLTSGDQYSCVLNNSGTSFCWGDNSSNQIAPTSSDQTTRVPTTFGTAADIEAGSLHLCALLIDASIKCLGDNSKAQSAVLSSSVSPIGPVNRSGLVKLSTGNSTTCAIDKDGILYCWGALIPELTPGQTFTDVAVGNVSACAVTTSGTVLCWGSNGSSQLGDGTNKSAVVPTQVSGFGSSKAQHIAAGFRHFCMNTTDGLVYCWGDNSHQQLGYLGADAKTATAVAGIGTAVDVATGTYHSCALLTGNSVYCWGDNSKHEINSSSSSKLGVTAITQAAAISKVRAGGNETCFLMIDSKLNCIGENTDLESPGLISGTFSDVAVGQSSVCVTRSLTFQVSCFGSNSYTKLGRTGLKSSVPSDVSGLLANGISVGDDNACAIDTAGKLKCWGSNSDGQLASSFGFPAAYADEVICIAGPANNGETINAAISNLEPQASVTYSWFKASDAKSNGALMPDVTASSYVVSKTDLNKYFAVAAIFSKWGTTSKSYRSANYGPAGPQIRILLSSIPTISGKAKLGQVLSAKPGTWDKNVIFSYQWYRGTVRISTGKSATYKLVAADVGKQISVWVTGSSSGLPPLTTKSLKTSKITR